MGAFSIWHWVIVLVVVLVLFGGKGKISALMGDFGKGMKDEEGENADASANSPKLGEDKTETVDQTVSEEKKNG